MRLAIGALGIAIALGAWAADAQDRPRLAADDLNAAPTYQVAAALLPTAEASKIVRHLARPPPGLTPLPRRELERADVWLYTAAVRNTEGLCRREVHVIEAERQQGAAFHAVQPVSFPYAALRLDSDCASAAGRTFASLSGASETEASAMLTRLADLQDDAKHARRLPVTIECATDYSGYTCPADPASLLADLPLEGAYAFRRSDDNRRDLLLDATEREPGHLFWEIRFVDEPIPVLILKRRIPPPP